jgi:hypothetical protein
MASLCYCKTSQYRANIINIVLQNTVVILGVKRGIPEVSNYTLTESEATNMDKIVGHSREQARLLFQPWWMGLLPVTKYPPDNREKTYERQTTVYGVCVDHSVLSRLRRNEHTVLWTIFYLKMMWMCWIANALCFIFSERRSVFVAMEIWGLSE